MTTNITKSSIHNFQVRALNSEEFIDFADFKGKKILIVNVASKCGFTYQYEELENLYQEHKNNLVIIGFPCNQFLNQEFRNEEKIAEFCAINYGVTFPLTEKVKVKGRKIHPIYEWLTNEEENGVGDFKVKWNFNKFLLDEDGSIIGHFSAMVRPSDEKITSLL